MALTARRVAWIVAAALVAVGGAAAVLQLVDDGAEVASPESDSSSAAAANAPEELRAEPGRPGRRQGDATGRQERRTREPGKGDAESEREQAMRRLEQIQYSSGPWVSIEETKPGDEPAPNVRPPDGASKPGRVLARDWTPATRTFTASPGRQPGATATRRTSDEPTEAEDAADVEIARSHGLRGDYFDFLDGQITDIADVSQLPPSFSRVDLDIDFDTDASFALPFVPDTFAVRWTGFLSVPEDGEYRFTCGSDDGARVKLDGNVVVDHPRLRPYAESGGAVKLTAGPHPIEVLFYENYGYASCRLWWDGPGWKRRIVAPEVLSPPAELAGVVPPAISWIDPPAGFVDDEVAISGIGFTSDTATTRVTFNRVPAEILSAESRRLTVRVPAGAATGDVVVEVGVLSSLPRRFTVKNLLGLYAEYFKLDHDLASYPDFEHIAPYFVRLDSNLDFLSDNLWNLPYDPDVFASRHTGFLYVPADDDYRLTLGSDDGARVALDGDPVLDMPGLHSYSEQSVTANLAKGFHAIEVLFFENRGAARLALYWQRPGEVTRSVIPEGFFHAPDEVAELPTPYVAKIAPAAAEIGGELEIRGSGFGTSERLVRVVFPGDVWVRPTAVVDDLVRVRVPYGAESGQLRVESGIHASNRVPLTIATPQGLTADYIVYPDRTSLQAAIDDGSILTRPASATRVETSWQRPDAKSWDLPFAMTTFAVHWHGTLAVEYPTDIDWIFRAAAGGHLLVDGGHVVDNRPWHELQERYGRSHLAPGEHTFDLWLAQSDAEPRLQLLYTPTGRLEHLPVPARWFLPREPRQNR